VTALPLAAALVLLACATDPGGTAQDHYRRALAAEQASDPARMVVEAEALVAAAGSGGAAPAQMSEYEDLLGRAYWEAARTPEAADAMRRSISFAREASGPDAPVLAPKLLFLGQVAREQGDLDGAIEALGDHNRIVESHRGANDPLLGEGYYLLARYHREAGHRPEAEAAFERAVGILELAPPAYRELCVRAFVEYLTYVRNLAPPEKTLALMRRLQRVDPEALRQVR
jgi:tetratricopeptide (TPR) repeat protein